MLSRTLIVLFGGLALAGLSGCGRSSETSPIRLVDTFSREMVKESSTKRNRPDPAGLWNFGEPTAGGAAEKGMLGWKAANGVNGLSLANGRLRGRTTTDFPIIYVERTTTPDVLDVLHSIEVRLRASVGAVSRP